MYGVMESWIPRNGIPGSESALSSMAELITTIKGPNGLTSVNPRSNCTYTLGLDALREGMP